MKGSSISADFSLTMGEGREARLRFVGTQVRRTNTGVHAKVHILLDQQMLAWNTFNVERDEDRTRLANAAHKAIGPLAQQVWTQAQMRDSLSTFCLGIWDAHVGKLQVGPMAGGYRAEGTAFAIYPFVIAGGGTIFFAPPGRGKSFNAMILCVSLDHGAWGEEERPVPTVFDRRRPLRSMYVNLERSADSMADRLARVNDALGLEPERPLHFANHRGRSLWDIEDALANHVEREGIEFVMLDSISRAGYGDLNENAPTNRIVDTLNGICPTWGALAHTSRQDEGHIYGSVHFDAGVDIAVKQTTQDDSKGTLGIGLTVTKGNDVPIGGKPLIYALEFDQGGLINIRDSRRGEFLLLAAGVQKNLAMQIQELLLQLGEMTATQIANELGIPKQRTHVSEILSQADWTTRRKAGKEVFYAIKYTGQEG